MSDAIISAVLGQLASVMQQQISQELTLVVGVDKDIENLKTTFISIKALLGDAEMRQVKDDTQSIKLWLQRLQDVVYDVDDVLSEWSTALLEIQIERPESPSSHRKKVCLFLTMPCFCFGRVVFRRDIAVKIQELNGRLGVIATEKDRYSFNTSVGSNEERHGRPHSTSYVDETKVQGRDGDKATLVEELLKESSRGGRSYHTISIVGTGGIGKTTLAQLAYNCDQVRAHFDRTVWVCVSEPPPLDELRVAKAIVEQLEGSSPNLFELETVLGRLRASIEGKKFLFVLDDVWTEDYQRWEPLRNSLNCGAPGSKVLVTTRKQRVAQIMESSYLLRLGQLTEQDCWLLFSQIALQERSRKDQEELEGIGRQIAKKCCGLPLAAKIIGNLMRFKDSVQEWRNVLENDMWELEAKKGIFPPLLLSYCDLPSPVKSCFLYCANFPQDYEIEADNLIKLWMAHDYLSSNGNVDMETTGKEYLDTLVMRSFFQLRKEKDKGRDNVIRFKMHDMVLELAQYLRKNESHVTEVNSGVVLPNNSSAIKARHLTLIRSEDSPFPASIGNIESLHTLWVQSFYDSPPFVSEVDIIPPDMLQHLVHLKTLDLSRNRLRELPREIEKLKNLRYLNLSHNPLWELPETVCFLYRLQTLKLVACNHLSRLPQKISKLENLRHLEIDRTGSLSTLPKGIGKLSSLRTLSKFVITGSSDGEETTCTIGDLNGLNQLRGSIKIEGLGYVVNAGEANKAELKKKKHLVDLHMDFHPQLRAPGRADVAEALELHPDLQSLRISFYDGAHLPGWMTSLTNLRKLRLEDCPNCTSLPPLGSLPSLENLCIEKMPGLKLIGDGFFGGASNMNDTTTHRNGTVVASATEAPVTFPKLKKLKFSCLSNWEEWKVTSQKTAGENGNPSIMPNLRYLKISDCGKVKALPDPLLSKLSMKKLYISNCPLLQQQYEKKTGEHWMKISHISKVRIS